MKHCIPVLDTAGESMQVRQVRGEVELEAIAAEAPEEIPQGIAYPPALLLSEEETLSALADLVDELIRIDMSGGGRGIG